jgi:uncharacterized protein YdaU (DUF1376 family)
LKRPDNRPRRVGVTDQAGAPAGVNFYPHHIGDYAKDTAHLSMLEDAAYRRMLDVAYGSEKPLPKSQEKIYRLVRARSNTERLAVDIVLGEFWIEGEDGWHNKRVEEELAKACQIRTQKLMMQCDRNANA